MNATGCDVDGTAERRGLPTSLTRSTYLFLGVLLNCCTINQE